MGIPSFFLWTSGCLLPAVQLGAVLGWYERCKSNVDDHSRHGSSKPSLFVFPREQRLIGFLAGKNQGRALLHVMNSPCRWYHSFAHPIRGGRLRGVLSSVVENFPVQWNSVRSLVYEPA